jgi:hypothetical protein
MALRATSGPTLATKSLDVGGVLTVTAKVENTASGEETVSLYAEELKEGLVQFEPLAVPVPGKSRRSVSFSWRAELPDGRDALTYRGKLVLRSTDTGQLVGSAPLDVYVRRA